MRAERIVLFVVSVPGINEWAEKIEKEKIDSGRSQFLNNSTAGDNPNKRKFEPDSDTNMDDMDTDDCSTKVAKKGSTMNSQPEQPNSVAHLSPEFLLNSPIAERPSKACIIKVKQYRTFTGLAIN